MVRIVEVSSCRPARATKTRLGSLIQISSTLGVVEVALERPEAGDPGDQLLDDGVVVLDGRHRAGEAALVVVTDDPAGQASYDGGVALRVDALRAHSCAQLGVERLDQVAVRVGIGQAHVPEIPRSLCHVSSE